MGRTEHRLFVFAHFFQKSQRSGKRTRHIHQEFDPQIHFQESITLFHAVGKGFAHITAAAFRIGIAINTDLIAVFTAEQLPHRNTPRFTRDIPHGNFQTAHTACLTGITAELFDPAEDLFHITGIFSEDTAFEHGGISTAGGIPHFTVTNDPLIGKDFDQRTAFRGTVNIRKTDIGDFQCGGINIGIHGSGSLYFMYVLIHLKNESCACFSALRYWGTCDSEKSSAIPSRVNAPTILPKGSRSGTESAPIRQRLLSVFKI